MRRARVYVFGGMSLDDAPSSGWTIYYIPFDKQSEVRDFRIVSPHFYTRRNIFDSLFIRRMNNAERVYAWANGS